MAAMLCGLMHGFHAVEFDVMLAADGVPVLMHDPLLGRTVAGSGAVSDFTSRQLQAMDAGAWKAPQFAGEPVADPGRQRALLAGVMRFGGEGSAFAFELGLTR